MAKAKQQTMTMQWVQSRPGLVISSVVALALCYLFASIAVDTASLWSYVLAFVWFGFAVKFLIGAVKGHAHK
jgi:ABC-type polysaccharide/polyol phosphate export permease